MMALLPVQNPVEPPGGNDLQGTIMTPTGQEGGCCVAERMLLQILRC